MPLRASRNIARVENDGIKESKVCRGHEEEEEEVEYEDCSGGAMPGSASICLWLQEIVRCTTISQVDDTGTCWRDYRTHRKPRLLLPR